MNIEDIKDNEDKNNQAENIKDHKRDSLDSAELNIESKINILENNLKNASKEFADVGGENGIEMTIGSKFLETKNLSKKDTSKNSAKETTIDELWEFTKDMISGNIISKTDMDYDFLDKLQRITGNASGVILGLAMIPASGTMKGIQDIGRKIKLALEKIKLRKPQSKN